MNYLTYQYDIYSVMRKTKVYSIIQTILGIVFIPSLVFFIIFNNSFYESLNKPFDPNNPYVSNDSSTTGWIISFVFMMSSLLFSLSITFTQMVLYSKSISVLTSNEKQKLKSVVPLLLINLLTFGISSIVIYFVNCKTIKKNVNKKSSNVNFAHEDILYHIPSYDYPSHAEEMGNKTWTQKHNKKPSVDEKINRIKEVSELKEKGFISEEEFSKLKEEIIKNS